MSVCLSAACLYYISLYTYPFAHIFARLSHVGILSIVDTTQHIRNFYHATHMHSVDYAIATCLSDRSSLCLSDSPSVYHTTGLPPCTHEFLSSFCICIPVHLPIHHIHTHNVFHICLCLLHSCAILSIHVCVSSCPFV